jgi:hypothetical protein
MRKPWIAVAAIIIFGCGADSPPQIYSSVRSPSGQSTAIKQYKGDEQILWDVLVIKHEGSGDRIIAMLQNQPVNGIWGSDGVVLGWDGEHHLIVGWPSGRQSVTGPTKVGDITLTYQAFAPDLDRAAQSVSKETALQDAAIDFDEIDSDSGAEYTATGRSVPHIRCVVRLRGTDPATSDSIVVEVIGDGMGRRGDPYPSFGMVDVAFTLKGNDEGKQPSLTQGKFGSVYPSFQPDRSPKQSDSSLLYPQYQVTEALKLFSDIRSGSIAIKLSPDFGRSVTTYRIGLPAGNKVSRVIGDFNKCTATTNLYGNGFHVPTE